MWDVNSNLKIDNSRALLQQKDKVRKNLPCDDRCANKNFEQMKNQFGRVWMNKKILFTLILTICMIGIMSTVTFGACSFCNSTSGDHYNCTGAHTYTYYSTTTHWERCCCGKYTFNNGQPVSHTFSSCPTCGKSSIRCSKCGYKKSHVCNSGDSSSTTDIPHEDIYTNVAQVTVTVQTTKQSSYAKFPTWISTTSSETATWHKFYPSSGTSYTATISLPSGTGVYYIHVYLYNSSGTNLGCVKTFTVYYNCDTTGPTHGDWVTSNGTVINDSINYVSTSASTYRVYTMGQSDDLSGVEASYLWISSDGGKNWDVISDVRMNETTINGTRAWYYDIPVPNTEKTYLVHTCPRDNAKNVTYDGPTQTLVIDSSGPTISVSDITYGQSASITLTDTASGIKYFAVTESTQTTEPIDYGNSEVTTGNKINYWYMVSNTKSAKTVMFTGLPVGTYKAWGKDATGNYSSKTFTVNKAKIAIPSAPANKVYNGKQQECGITLPDHASIDTSNGVSSATHAGTYKVVVKLDNNTSTNYEWSDGTVASKTISWTIEPKEVAVVWESTDKFIYNGLPQGPSATVSSGISGETINLIYSSEIEPGTYVSTASISSVTGNSSLSSNYKLTNNTKTYEICVKLNKPVIEAANQSGDVPSKTWSNDDLSISIYGATTEEQGNLRFQYSYDGVTWEEFLGEPILYTTETKGAKFYARGYDPDNPNIVSDIAVYEIYLDKTPPTDIELATTSTTSTITLEVTSVNADIAGAKEYVYYLDGEYQLASKNKVHTFTGLDAGSIYAVCVVVVDNAGNESEYIEEFTYTADLSDKINLIPSTTDYTNDSVTVSIEWPDTNLERQVKIGEDGTWEAYSDTTYVVTENTMIYARLTDGVNNGEAASLEISNIDREAPTGTIDIVPVYEKNGEKATNSNTVTIQITAQDNCSIAAGIRMAILNEQEFNELSQNDSLAWEQYVQERTWQLPAGEGVKTVYILFKDEAGNQSYYVVEE